MPKRIVPLSELQIKNAKPQTKEYKLSDGGGLYLLVTPTGGKLWRMKYSFAGKEKLLSFGGYPEISLTGARNRREDARKLLANGIDPGEMKKTLKQARTAQTENSFEAVAREWGVKFLAGKSESHRERTLANLERDVFPWIGNRPIAEIKPMELLATLKRVEDRGALETAHRVRMACSQIFRYAVATGRADRDPAADLRGALPPYKKGHHAAITEPKEVTKLLRAIDEFQGSFVVKCSLQLAPLLFARPGELRHMEWAEIDFDESQWNIPAEKMKMKQPHIVPLCKQAVNILKEIQSLTGHSKYVFPCHRTPLKPMSENALLAAIRRIGYTKEEMTPHGFRAMARTLLDEVLGFRPDYIEAQLAHQVKDPNGRAYNRTSHLPERRKMMQQWADYLDGLKTGAKVIPMKRVV